MSCEDDGGAVGSELVVHGVNLKLLRDAFGKNRSWDFDSEILLILLCFFPSAIDESAAIRDHTVADTAYLSGNVIDPLVGTRNHHFVVDDLFSAQDDAILANHPKDCAKAKCRLTKESGRPKIIVEN